jgi:hypothetical protein
MDFQLEKLTHKGGNLSKSRTLIKVLTWLQLVLSVLLAASILIGYFSYRGSFGLSIEALAENIASVSTVVETTAETVQLNQSLIESTRQTIVLARIQVEEVNAIASNLAKQAPQYVDFFRTASAKVVHLGDSLTSVAEGLMFSAPTSIQMEGLRPVIVTSMPLEAYAKKLKASAQEIKELGSAISSTAIEGSRKVVASSATTNQLLVQLGDSEKLLDRLQRNDLPKALKEMKSTSENIRTISQQVSVAGNVGGVLFIFGLLLAIWCFLNSLSILFLANEHSATSTATVEPTFNQNNTQGS